MNTSLYKNFIRLLEKWPLDRSKVGRDLGEYIRTAVGPEFLKPHAEKLSSNESVHSSLNRISTDYYKKVFHTSAKSSASGLSESECQEVVSNDFLAYLNNEENKSDRVLNTPNSKQANISSPN